MNVAQKKVAVIGAGPAGITTLKTLREEGHDAVCFEKSPGIGGIFRYTQDQIGVYDTTLMTSSACFTAYSDFFPGAKAPLHFKHDEYLKYLQDYIESFQIKPYIHLNHEIKNLEQLPQGGWRLTILGPDSPEPKELIFDAVAVCSGLHQHCAIPEIPGLNKFQGTTLHSGYYRNPKPFEGKNVVIVGAGESGSDIIYEVSNVTRSCFVSLRRGVLVIPRLVFGKPNDYYTSRLFYTVPSWILRERNTPGMFWPRTLSLLLTGAVLCLLLELVWDVIHFIAGLSRAADIVMALALNGFMLYVVWGMVHYFFIYLGVGVLNVIAKLNFMSLAGHGEQFLTKCQGVAKALSGKKCVLKGLIKQFLANGVEFSDGTIQEIDSAIFCTGYRTVFPFLNNREVDCRGLYKNCFDPALGQSLCFIGLARPPVGAMPTIAEMQARWFSQILIGSRSFPPADEMKKIIKEDGERHKKCFAVNSDRITGLVNYTTYMDELAGFIGCRPSFMALCFNPFLLYRIYFNPYMACQFRLIGPWAKRRLAKETLSCVPIGIFQFLYNCGFVCIITACHILYRLGWKRFKPLLPL